MTNQQTAHHTAQEHASRLFDESPFAEPQRALNTASAMKAAPSAKSLLRNRAASLRHTAEQLEVVAGMLPEVLSPEQEQALMTLLAGAQFAL